MHLDIAPDYTICKDGRVWSSLRNKYLKQSYDNNKYRVVNLKTINGYRTFRVHQLVAMAFIPNPQNLKQVNHKDYNKSNNKISNLEWITASDNIHWNYGTNNMQDRFNKYIEDGLDLETAFYAIC